MRCLQFGLCLLISAAGVTSASPKTKTRLTASLQQQQQQKVRRSLVHSGSPGAPTAAPTKFELSSDWWYENSEEAEGEDKTTSTTNAAFGPAGAKEYRGAGTGASGNAASASARVPGTAFQDDPSLPSSSSEVSSSSQGCQSCVRLYPSFRYETKDFCPQYCYPTPKPEEGGCLACVKQIPVFSRATQQFCPEYCYKRYNPEQPTENASGCECKARFPFWSPGTSKYCPSLCYVTPSPTPAPVPIPNPKAGPGDGFKTYPLPPWVALGCNACVRTYGPKYNPAFKDFCPLYCFRMQPAGLPHTSASMGSNSSEQTKPALPPALQQQQQQQQAEPIPPTPPPQNSDGGQSQEQSQQPEDGMTTLPVYRNPAEPTELESSTTAAATAAKESATRVDGDEHTHVQGSYTSPYSYPSPVPVPAPTYKCDTCFSGCPDYCNSKPAKAPTPWNWGTQTNPKPWNWDPSTPKAPTKYPTQYPSSSPTALPSCEPSVSPSMSPSRYPSRAPSSSPSASYQPSLMPSLSSAPSISTSPSTIEVEVHSIKGGAAKTKKNNSKMRHRLREEGSKKAKSESITEKGATNRRTQTRNGDATSPYGYGYGYDYDTGSDDSSYNENGGSYYDYTTYDYVYDYNYGSDYPYNENGGSNYDYTNDGTYREDNNGGGHYDEASHQWYDINDYYKDPFYDDGSSTCSWDYDALRNIWHNACQALWYSEYHDKFYGSIENFYKDPWNGLSGWGGGGDGSKGSRQRESGGSGKGTGGSRRSGSGSSGKGKGGGKKSSKGTKGTKKSGHGGGSRSHSGGSKDYPYDKDYRDFGRKARRCDEGYADDQSDHENRVGERTGTSFEAATGAVESSKKIPMIAGGAAGLAIAAVGAAIFFIVSYRKHRNEKAVNSGSDTTCTSGSSKLRSSISGRPGGSIKHYQRGNPSIANKSVRTQNNAKSTVRRAEQKKTSVRVEEAQVGSHLPSYVSGVDMGTSNATMDAQSNLVGINSTLPQVPDEERQVSWRDEQKRQKVRKEVRTSKETQPDLTGNGTWDSLTSWIPR